jgi:molecular chaperone GrpE
MNQDQEIESLENAAEDADETVSVDDFIRQLEAKEKDLHITAETTIIEIAEGFDDGELPDFLKQEFPAAAATAVKPAAAPTPKDDAELRKLEAEVKSLRDSSAKLEVEKSELTKDIQRHAKDLANYRQRMDRERRESFQNQVGNLATQMLPVLDNLNRAIDFAIDHEHTKDEEFRPFYDGVFLVNQQLNEVLGEMGITPIATVGEQFDPHLHEAAATQETDEWPANAICEELLKGYRIGERVIRHSVVKVAKPVPGAEPSVLDKLFEGEAEDAEPPTEQASDVSENSPE